MKHQTTWILVAAIWVVVGFMMGQAQNAQQAANQNGTLLVDTDDTCQLFLDDEDKGEITPDKAQKFTVGLGEHILKCKIKSTPDLVWRRVVDVQDKSQVAAVVSLRALHLQYDQAAAAKTKNDQASAGRQLEEAEAQIRLRQKSKVEMPQVMLSLVHGNWQGVSHATVGSTTISESYQYNFTAIEDGRIVAYLIFGGRMRYKDTFTPVAPNRLEGLTELCISTKDKSLMKPGAKKDSDGWTDCWGHNRPPEPLPKDAIIQINGSMLTYTDPSGSFTLTR